MLTIILPGNSFRNKEWAQETGKKLNLEGKTVPYMWEYWEAGGDLDMESEIACILSLVGKQDVSLVAKSIGTKVLMGALPQIYK